MATFRMVSILGLCSVIVVACATNPPYRLGPIGGPGGSAFDEYTDGSVPANAELTAIHAPIEDDICGHPNTPLVHYIQSGYSPPPGFQGDKHGGGLVCPGTFTIAGLPTVLQQGEFLTGIYGRGGVFIDHLRFVSNKSGFNSFAEIEQQAAQIASGGNPFFLLAPPGYKVRRWFGRAGAAVDAIGIRAEEEPNLPKTGFPWYKLGAVGGWGGGAFEDPPVSPSVRVTTITVTAGCYVSGVKFHYSDGSQTAHGGAAIGIIGGCVAAAHTFNLDPDEFIRGINGHAGEYIDQVEFVTNKRSLGPLGGGGGAPFALIGPPDYRVKRLFGRSGAFIDALGIIVEK